MKQIIYIMLLLVGFSATAQEKKWTLKESVSHALENNISVLQGKNTLLSNEQDIIAAKGQFLPSFSGNLGQGMNIGSGFDPVSNSRISNQIINSFNYGVNASVNIFNGFRLTNLYKQSQLNLETNQLELNRIKDDISLNVVNAYLNVLFNIENLDIAKSQYEFTKKQLDQVNKLVDAGVQPAANVYDAEATLSRDLQSVTVAKNNYDIALLTLSQLLQVPYEGFEVEVIEIDDPSELLLYTDARPIVNYATENRYEIKVAEKNIENSALSTEISKSGYLPSVSFSYGFGSVWSESRNDLIKNSFFRELDVNKGHRLNLNVNVPIFSRYQNKTNVAKSQIQEANAQLGLDQTKLSIEANVQRAFADAKAAFRSYEAAKVSLQAQKIAFQNSQERYNIGAMNAFDLEQTRLRLVNAESSLVNAKFDFIFKTKVLDFYLGKPITQ